VNNPLLDLLNSANETNITFETEKGQHKVLRINGIRAHVFPRIIHCKLFDTEERIAFLYGKTDTAEGTEDEYAFCKARGCVFPVADEFGKSKFLLTYAEALAKQVGIGLNPVAVKHIQFALAEELANEFQIDFNDAEKAKINKYHEETD